MPIRFDLRVEARPTYPPASLILSSMTKWDGIYSWALSVSP